MIIEYRVFKQTDLKKLERMINLSTDKGWEPIGGIAINNSMPLLGTTHYIQAMVRR